MSDEGCCSFERSSGNIEHYGVTSASSHTTSFSLPSSTSCAAARKVFGTAMVNHAAICERIVGGEERPGANRAVVAS